ncbi:MAG: hypothetical protein U0414_05170 [Polyangiaceae bacterium]
MCSIRPEERAEIARYLSCSRVICRVAFEAYPGTLSRAQRVHEAYLTAFQLLTRGIEGRHGDHWRALLSGARRELDRAVAPVIRARLVAVSRVARGTPIALTAA